MKIYINHNGQILVNGKNVGYHEEGCLYRFGTDGFSQLVASFDNRRELEELIRKEWGK